MRDPEDDHGHCHDRREAERVRLPAFRPCGDRRHDDDRPVDGPCDPAGRSEKHASSRLPFHARDLVRSTGSAASAHPRLRSRARSSAPGAERSAPPPALVSCLPSAAGATWRGPSRPAVLPPSRSPRTRTRSRSSEASRSRRPRGSPPRWCGSSRSRSRRFPAPARRPSSRRGPSRTTSSRPSRPRCRRRRRRGPEPTSR